MHWNSLRSLLRTYEMSTCRKSIVSICHYSTRRKKRGMRVVGVQQTNSGGEGRRRKGKVVSFPGPSLPPTSMHLLLLLHVLAQVLRTPPPPAPQFLYTWCRPARKAKCVIVSDAKYFVNARNRAEKKTLLAGVCWSYLWLYIFHLAKCEFYIYHPYVNSA